MNRKGNQTIAIIVHTIKTLSIVEVLIVVCIALRIRIIFHNCEQK